VHNGNDEVNESEPIVVEEPKKEVKLYGFSWWVERFLKHVFCDICRTRFPTRLMRTKHWLRKSSPNKHCRGTRKKDLNEMKRKGI
jgi:hypothetical protein